MDLFTYLMAKKGHNTHRDLFSYLLGKKSQLPSEYQRLEYIESTGTQYIDTGVNADSNKKISITTQYTDISSTNNTNMFAIRVSGNNATRLHFLVQVGGRKTFRLYYGLAPTNIALWTDLGLADTLKHNFEFDLLNGNLKKDNTKYTIEKLNFNLDMNMYLFARNAIGGDVYYNKSKLYSCEIYDNGVLVRNFIPCMRKSDNEVGLYDTIGKQFYTNQGTGKFAYKGYTFVEYIESTGTQYIDSGVNADDINYSFDIDLYGYETQPTTYYRNFGYQRNGGIFLGTKFWYGNNTNINSTDDLGTFNDERHSVFANKDYAIVDNVKYNLNTSPTSFIKNTFTKIAIFGSFDGGNGVIRNDSYSKIKLYNFKIYHSNKLIRNFIPAIRKSDNVAGLYDLANDTFYTNAGTGTFVTPTSQLSSMQSLNTSLLSSNLQEETNIDDMQEEPNLDGVNEIENIEQNDEPIENEEVEESIEEYQEL